MNKLDIDYKNINNTLEEYKNKLLSAEAKTIIFPVTSIGRMIENSAEIIFERDSYNHYVVNIKYMTSSFKYDVLDITSIKLSETGDNIISINFKDGRIENFRTNEGNKIIEVYNKYYKSAVENLDVKKAQKEDRRKKKEIKKNVRDMFDIFAA